VQKPSIPKGTRDFGPAQTAKRKYIISSIEAVFKKYGFMPLETPAMENLSVLMGKYGTEGDQLIFKVLNSGDYLKKASVDDYQAGSQSLLHTISEKGLRYDLTVPFARYVSMHQNEINFPFKRYQIQPVWRADRPQRGRYREFYQCDADIIAPNRGFQSGWKEVELTLMIGEVFSKLGLDAYEIRINHRDLLFGIADFVEMKGQEIPFCAALDKIEKIGREAVVLEVKQLGANTTKMNQVLDAINLKDDTPSMLERLQKLINGGQRGFDELSQFLETLSPFNSKIIIDFSLARGLSYYTGLIYEVVPTSVKMGSICGGGRYDDLTGIFGLPDISGIGISFGLDRIYDVLEELNLFPERSEQFTKVMIAHLDEESFRQGIQIVQQMRSKGIASELYPEQVKLKKQIQFANKSSIPYVLTIGSDELASETFNLKDLETGDQQNLSLDQIIDKLLAD
jgi:histidyl-tRNA synthetase